MSKFSKAVNHLQISVVSPKAAVLPASVEFDWLLHYPFMGHAGRFVERGAACSCLFNWSSSKTHARLNAPVIPFAFCSPSFYDGSSRRRFPRSADLFLDLRCRNKILFTQKRRNSNGQQHQNRNLKGPGTEG